MSMNHRFRNEEQSKYSETYGNDLLFVICSRVGPELQTQMPEFGMCPEEMYYEVEELLQWLIAHPKSTPEDINQKWHRLYNNYLSFDRHVSTEDLRRAVGIVFTLSSIALNSSLDTDLSLGLPQKLFDCIAHKDHAFKDWAIMCDRIFDQCELPEGWLDEMKKSERVMITMSTETAHKGTTEYHYHLEGSTNPQIIGDHGTGIARVGTYNESVKQK